MIVAARGKFLSGVVFTRGLVHVGGRGFTLIELLIVIAIMGILAAAVLIAINPIKRQNAAKDANVKADISAIGTAAQAYFTSAGSGSYTLTSAELVTLGEMRTVPLDPSGVAYTYVVKNSAGAACTTAANDCVKIAISRVLYWPTDGTKTWCMQGATGQGKEILTTALCPAS